MNIGNFQLDPAEMFGIVSKMRTAEISQSELKKLILNSAKIAFISLKKKYSFLSRKFNLMNMSLEDVAADSIVPLFIIDPSTKQYYIKNALDNWISPIDNEIEVSFFLNKIIWERLDYEVMNLMRQYDPFFSKIIKSFYYQIHKYQYLKVFHFGTAYIVENKEQLNSTDFIDTETFATLPGSIFSGQQENVLNCVFDYLRNQTGYYPAVPLNLLVLKVIEMLAGQLTALQHSAEAMSIDDYYCMDEQVGIALSASIEKLNQLYVINNKLTPFEAESIKFILFSVVDDLRCGGKACTLYDYCLLYMPGVNREVFYEKYHYVVDYLVRILKNNLRTVLSH